jgi:protein phosphatase
VPLDDGGGERATHDLDLQDVVGKRIIETKFARTVTIREENAIAALEVMTRFAVDPRWLAYLPPTMSPTAT